ncbi:hypothetical protein [Halomonas tibetensis]|uniref:Uncharacterized protein n=1 Tax=Halomonas tibetensis TaxID=2259590 RepID=A0ABV7B7H5_9GAMM
MAGEDMFESDVDFVKSGRGHEIKWRLVTNHQNLMFMLSAGMIMPPNGFGKKYYQDTLSLLPGWVPLFPEALWKSAIVESVSEQNFLRPCYAELDLSRVSGGVKVLRSGCWEDAQFPDEVYGSEDLILVPAPLPISMISEVVFSSKVDKEFCDKDAQNFSNVPLEDFKTKTAVTPFKKTKLDSWPPPINGAEERHVELTLPDAFGGVVTLLSCLSNRDDVAMQLAGAFFHGTPDDEITHSFPMLLSSHAMFYSPDMAVEQHGASGALFRNISESLVRWREVSGNSSPKDIIMGVLETSNAGLEGKAKQAGERLMGDLRCIVQFPEKTLDELLKVHQKPLPRSLIIFFMNDSSLDLLEISNANINGYEFCGAAILFGITEGWMRMPTKLRESNDLHLIVPDYMAFLSHSLSGSSLKFGSLPDRPRSLREHFSETPSNKKSNNVALYVARACKWDCINTRIKLGKGEYKMLIDGSGASLILDGDVKAVQAEVDQEKFMAFLRSETDIPSRVENEARKMLRT